jgi:hypothetical protein
VHEKTVIPPPVQLWVGDDRLSVVAEWWWLIAGDDSRPVALGEVLHGTEWLADVRLHVHALGGVHGLEVRARSPLSPSPVSARMMRTLPITAMERVVRERARWSALPGVAEAFTFGEDLGPWSATRPGRKGRGDTEYARVARRYVELLGTHEQPTVVLADELALSSTQARSVLAQARARGLLTEAPKGRAGGQLTAKAIELLRGTT